jgi:protein gp37
MSATSIEWTDKTWNPVTGCTKISAGCDHCYAEKITERFQGRGSFAEVRQHHNRLGAPLTWRKPARVFVNSMSDLFHDDVPDEYIGSVFEVMAQTPQHTYQILTKRHARMRALLTKWAQEGARYDWAGPGTAVFRRDDKCWVGPIPWPLPNVWLGVSVETQQWADIRIPALLDTPAAVRFLSCEPLLGPVDLLKAVIPMGSERGHGLTASYVHTGGCCVRFHGIDWVIVGGESGPGARPMALEWARSLVEQCSDAETPVFVKQLGSAHGRSKGGDMATWPAELRVREWPRGHAAGTDVILRDRERL